MKKVLSEHFENVRRSIRISADVLVAEASDVLSENPQSALALWRQVVSVRSQDQRSHICENNTT